MDRSFRLEKRAEKPYATNCRPPARTEEFRRERRRNRAYFQAGCFPLSALADSVTQSSQPIQFFHRGAMQSVADVPITQTVLDWLRENARCGGTKEGCNEGDCGACTVVVGTPKADGSLSLKAVNSCIQFLPTLHGKALFTVEDVAHEGKLHPCQQAMVECHGSQCGFCTPGFVMTLFAYYEQQRAAGKGAGTRQDIDDALSGNLCRCTGYRPIIDATRRMFELADVTVPPAKYRANISNLLMNVGSEFTYAGFHAPTTREQFARLRQAHPSARILAGSTDVGLWVTKQFRTQTQLLYIGNVTDLKHATVKDGVLRIGAAVKIEGHLAPGNVSFKELWLRFASPLIRNAGTLAGNVANGSPIGDSMPALIALNARVLLQKGQSLRELPLEELYLAYQKTALGEGEFVAEILIPLAPAAVFRTYKISKRFDQDISAVCFAANALLENGIAKNVRIAFGGMAGTPKRATQAERALDGRPFTRENVTLAMAALAQDFTPLSDMRASKEYRLQVAQNLLLKWWLETNPSAPKSVAQLSVRAMEAA
jgi:xanthine dehydrogenase small subunit